MRFRDALRLAGVAVRLNLRPGLLLQALMGLFLAADLMHDGTRKVLAEVARLKQETGYWFAFGSYVVAAVLLPELMRIIFLQGGRPRRGNAWSVLTAVPLWGGMGIVVDLFYRCQAGWFGSGGGLATIVPKVAVDQLLFTPFFSAPASAGYLAWRDARFRAGALRSIVSRVFYMQRVFPVVVSGWCVWIPGVSIVYFMPGALQIPTAALIQCFWVLMLMTVMAARVRG